MIRYNLRAFKSRRDGQLNLANRTERKNKEKQKPSNSERFGQYYLKAVREKEVKLRGVRFMKEVDFKLGVKERVVDEQSGESKEEEMMGEGIGELEMEELVSE